MGLLFRDQSHDTDGQTVGVRHLGRDELDAGLLQAEQKVRVAGQSVELSDQQHAAAEAAFGEGQAELRAVSASAALNLFESRHNKSAASRGVTVAGRWCQWTSAYLFATPERWASDTGSRSAIVLQ
jgi:hypothetical protein